MTKINDCIECGQPAEVVVYELPFDSAYVECTQCIRATRSFHIRARVDAIKEWNADNIEIGNSCPDCAKFKIYYCPGDPFGNCDEFVKKTN